MHEASEEHSDPRDGHPRDSEPTAAPAQASDDVTAIETLPLADRADHYQELAARLRSELERSDPARDA